MATMAFQEGGYFGFKVISFENNIGAVTPKFYIIK
jgi:hypothetical protein